VRHCWDQQQKIVHRHLYGIRDRRLRRITVHVVDTEFAALEDPRRLDLVIKRVAAIGAIARMRPQTARLMRDTVRVEGIQADLLWRLLPLAPAGCGT
jgi:hypothetical protein